MKKLIAVLLAVLMTAAFTACGEKAVKTDDVEKEIASLVSSLADYDDTEKEDPTADFDFEEFTAVDTDECSITIKDIVYDSFWGYTLKAYIENKTSDRSMTVTIDNASINGVEISSIMYEDVPAGKNTTSDIILEDDVLTENGIDKITDVAVNFKIHETDKYDEYVFNDVIHVYPYGEDAAEMFVREPLDTDVVVLDNEYVTVIFTGTEHDDIYDNVANFYILNKSDIAITLGADDVSVNGSMLEPLFYPSLSAGNCRFDNMHWSDEDFEENGIEEIEEIEFTLHANERDDIFSDNMFEETVTINP